jgi:hypothetical protein
MYDRHDLKWIGRKLRLTSGRLLATVEPDGNFLGMFRIRLPSGHLTDMVNLTRAKDAAISMALTDLNIQAGRNGRRPWQHSFSARGCRMTPRQQTRILGLLLSQLSHQPRSQNGYGQNADGDVIGTWHRPLRCPSDHSSSR